MPPISPDTTLPSAKARFLETHELYSAAVFHRARDLATLPGDARTLEELAELARKAAHAARGTVATPSPESLLHSSLERRIQSAAESVLTDLMEEEVAAAERLLGEFQDEPRPPRPPPSPPAAASSEAIRDPALRDAEALLEEGRILLREGRVAEAAERFRQLLDTGPAARERFGGALSAEVRHLLWTTLLPDWAGTNASEALRAVLDLARSLELEEVLPLGERLLLASLPEDRRPLELERLLNEAPGSVPFLHASAALAARRGDPTTRARHLTSLGWALLDAGEITPASRFFMEAKAMGAEGQAASEGLTRVFAFGESLAQAAAAYRKVERRLQEQDDPRYRAEICDEFLAEYPGYLPAVERRLELAAERGERARAAELAKDLARRALLRGDQSRARALLRQVVSHQPDDDEALLQLATFEPLGAELPRDLPNLRVQLLCREGLHEAAIHHARRQLKGTSEDLPTHELLVLLCRQAGRDPGPHLLALGRLAMEDDDAEFARRYFREAVETAPDPERVIAGVLEIPGIEGVFPEGARDGLRVGD